MAYRSIAFIPNGEHQHDAAPLRQLCRGFAENVRGVHLLALSAGSARINTRQVKLLAGLLKSCDCDLHIIR